jgi:Ca2+-binding EF-hand superfamily protein
MSLGVEKAEFYKMLCGMGFNRAIDERTSNEIFDSIDLNDDGNLSIAEFTAEFQQVC